MNCNVFTILLTSWQAMHYDCLITSINNTNDKCSAWEQIHIVSMQADKFGTLTCTCHGRLISQPASITHVCEHENQNFQRNKNARLRLWWVFHAFAPHCQHNKNPLHNFVYRARRQLDNKLLVWWPGLERRHYSNHIEQGGAHVYRQIQQLFHFLKASQN